MTRSRIALTLLMILLAGCATPPASREPETSPGGRPPVGKASAPEQGPAPALALRQRAVGQLAAGDPGQAAATLERALSIAPDDAASWLELGWVRLAQGDAYQASVLAGRARSLSDDPVLECRAARLVEAARHRPADVLGARAAAMSACRPDRG